MVTLIEEFIYAVAKRTALLFFVLLPLLLSCLWLWYQWRFRRVLAAAKTHPTVIPTLPLLGHLYWFFLRNNSELTRMLIKAVKDTVSRGVKSMCLWAGPHPIVFFFDSKDIRIITTSTKAVRENQLTELFLGNGLFTAMGDTHKIKRAHMDPIFGLKNLKILMPVFNESSKQLVDKLSQYSGAGPIDVKHVIKYVTLHSIAGMTFGPKIKFKTFSEDMENLEKAVSGMTFTFLHRNYKFWLRSENVLKLCWKSILEEINSCWKKFSDRPLKELKELQLKYERDVDLLNSSESKDCGQTPLTLPDVFATMMQKYPEFSDYDMQSDIKTFLFGGSGSTREAISYMLLSLAAFPKIQDKLYEEIISVVGPERDITLDDINQMTYLNQVFKETLRKYSITSFFTRKVMEDLQLSNCTVPAGTTVAVCPLGLHHDPAVFPNPENFDPDRFSPENAAKLSRWHFLPFGYGRNHCIGLQYAGLTIKTMAVQVLRRYRLSTKMDVNNLKFLYKIILMSEEGYNIEFIDRN